MGSKSIKIRSGIDPKCDHFSAWLLDRFWRQLGANLAPTGSQNGAKLAPSWPQNRAQEAIQEQLAHKSKNFQKCCTVVKIKGSRCQDRGQVGSKIDPKSIQEAIKNKSQLGWHFGGLLGPTWLQNGAKLRRKLGPSWLPNRENGGPRGCQKRG